MNHVCDLSLTVVWVREAEAVLCGNRHKGCRPMWFSGGGNVNFQQSRITDFLSMNSPKPSSKAALTSNHNIL